VILFTLWSLRVSTSQSPARCSRANDGWRDGASGCDGFYRSSYSGQSIL